MPAYIYRVSQWLEKRFNAKGGQVITDLDPRLGVEMTFPSGVEDRYLQGWNRFAVATNVAALAANFGRARIRNPGGSNVIAVLEMLSILEVGAGAVAETPIATWGAVTTDLTNLVGLTFTRMDPRGNPTPTVIVSFVAQAAGGQALLQKGITVAGGTVEFIQNPNQEIPILPGQAVDLQSSTANTQAIMSFMWRERALELSELT